jgi:hypothetical protein
MHWPLWNLGARSGEREEKEVLRRYLQGRAVTPSKAWVATVEDAQRRADAVLQLERRLQASARAGSEDRGTGA